MDAEPRLRLPTTLEISVDPPSLGLKELLLLLEPPEFDLALKLGLVHLLVPHGLPERATGRWGYQGMHRGVSFSAALVSASVSMRASARVVACAGQSQPLSRAAT